jgi:hypothetical protein
VTPAGPCHTSQVTCSRAFTLGGAGRSTCSGLPLALSTGLNIDRRLTVPRARHSALVASARRMSMGFMPASEDAFTIRATLALPRSPPGLPVGDAAAPAKIRTPSAIARLSCSVRSINFCVPVSNSLPTVIMTEAFNSSISSTP